MAEAVVVGGDNESSDDDWEVIKEGNQDLHIAQGLSRPLCGQHHPTSSLVV